MDAPAARRRNTRACLGIRSWIWPAPGAVSLSCSAETRLLVQRDSDWMKTWTVRPGRTAKPWEVNGYVHWDFLRHFPVAIVFSRNVTFISASLLQAAVPAVSISGFIPWCFFVLFCIWAQSAVTHVTLEEVITSPLAFDKGNHFGHTGKFL